MTHVILMFLGIVVGLLILAPNRRAALWYGWPFALLMIPTWMAFRAGSLTVNARNIADSIIFLGLVVRFDPEQRFRPRISDLVIALLAVSVLASAYLAKTYGFGSIPTVSMEWFLPYLMGRCLLGSPADMRRALWMLMACCLLLSMYACFEAVARVNILTKIFGITFKFLREDATRLGLKRAQAMSTHPIYFGLIMSMLLPWAIEARRLAKARQGPSWWLVMPFVALAGVFVSLSRSAWAAGLLCLMGHFFFTHRRWRIPLLIVAIVGGTTVIKYKEQFVDLVHSMVRSGSEEEDSILIIIDGEYYVYTGSRHRLLLFKVYEEYLTTAGWFGFGPEKRKVVLDESLSLFNSIDDHYILFILEYGYAGVTLFVVLALTIQCYLLRIAWPLREPYAPLAGSLLGALLAIDLGLLTVWFAPDFGLVWLFNTGAAVNLYDLSRRYKTKVGADAAAPSIPTSVTTAAGLPAPAVTALPGPGWPR
jgi:hypothetical protein